MKKEKVEILMWLFMSLTAGIAYFSVPTLDEILVRFFLGFVSGGSFVYSMFRFVRI